MRCPQARFVGELEEEAQRLVRDAVLRVVEVDAGRLEREALARARGSLGEQFAQVQAADAIACASSAFQAGRSTTRSVSIRQMVAGARIGSGGHQAGGY